MTKIILTFVFYLISIFAFSQDSATIENLQQKNISTSIKVVINKVVSNKGQVVFALYDQKGFLVKPLKSLTTLITGNQASVTFKDVPNGFYAIISYHDSNINNTLDFSKNGMPLEDYGASRNNISFGPPQFNTSKFEVKDKDLTFEIKY